LNQSLKIATTLLALAFATFAGAAAEKPAVAPQDVKAVSPAEAKAVEIIKLDVELRYQGQVIDAYTTYAPVGSTTVYQNILKTSYVESAIKREGVLKLNNGSVTSGFEMEMSPRALVANGTAVIGFTASYKQLLGIDKVKQDDLDVESPRVSEVRMTQNVYIEKGKAVEIESIGTIEEPAKYKLIIKAS
jgi:hypothetical protein